MKFALRRPTSRSFAGKRALVTGGVSGLGLAMTKILASEDAQVLVVDVHDPAPDGVLPSGVEYRKLDVRSDEDWDETRNWVETNWGGLDYLFNNGGVAAGGHIDVEEMDNWKRVVDINLLGVVRGCRTFTPMFKQQGGGHIVNTASLAGLVHPPSMASYNTVKAGVVALSETLRHELHPLGIEVSVICPSFFRTNLAQSLQGKDVDAEAKAVNYIENASRSAEQIAQKAIEGVRRGTFIILPDAEAVGAYNAKRFARPVYDRAMFLAAQADLDGEDPMASVKKLRGMGKKRREA